MPVAAAQPSPPLPVGGTVRPAGGSSRRAVTSRTARSNAAWQIADTGTLAAFTASASSSGRYTLIFGTPAPPTLGLHWGYSLRFRDGQAAGVIRRRWRRRRAAANDRPT